MQDSVLEGTMSTVLQRLFKPRQKCAEVTYTLSEVADHCSRNDCWIIVEDNVYDVTSFIDSHPGGYDVLMELAGRDATVAFYGAGHHPNTRDLLKPFLIGSLAHHERVNLIGTVSSSRNRFLWSRDRVAVVE
ncbi:cytochrome b5 [Trichonephila inaurata madagascariensis]|uniref:Cytochrome b5 n=1 Tax=Trichonephila inaurata madagascariensis TaxID=2747483 RepID=A0A8X6YY08_9ARAC|nr:cytochrome b5 [Trichonephila inaurata madagascariensis]